MISINDPFVLLNITFLGIGMGVMVEKLGGKWVLCAAIEAVVWTKCWTWEVKWPFRS